MSKALFEGLIFGGKYGGKFAFQNRLGLLIVGRKFSVFSLFYLVFEGTVFKYKSLGGLYSEGPFNERFFALAGLRGLHLEGLIHEGTYFRNFTV